MLSDGNITSDNVTVATTGVDKLVLLGSSDGNENDFTTDGSILNLAITGGKGENVYNVTVVNRETIAITGTGSANQNSLNLFNNIDSFFLFVTGTGSSYQFSYRDDDASSNSVAATDVVLSSIYGSTDGNAGDYDYIDATGAGIVQGIYFTCGSNEVYLADANGNVYVYSDAESLDVIATDQNYDISASGDSEEDYIYLGNGNNYVTTGSGDDIITCGNGNNYVASGAGDDSILTGSGNDTLYGDAGNDTLNGGDGANTMYGGDGTTTSTGHDVLYGQWSKGYLLYADRYNSPNDQYTLIMESNGNLALYYEYGTADITEYRVGYNGNTGTYLSMQSDGNLVIVSSDGVGQWSAYNVFGPEFLNPNNRLNLDDDGDLFFSGGSQDLVPPWRVRIGLRRAARSWRVALCRACRARLHSVAHG